MIGLAAYFLESKICWAAPSFEKVNIDPAKRNKQFRNTPDNQYILKRLVIVFNENNTNRIDETAVPRNPTSSPNLKFHCNKIPAAKGISKRKKGASFQIGIASNCIRNKAVIAL